MNYLAILIDKIGFLTPVILFIITFYLLFKKQTYLYYFSAGLVINNILNIILKIIIKEPRPNSEFKNVELAVKNGENVYFDKFGMPSAHLQNSFYILIYTLLAIGPTKFANMFILYITLSVICAYQRFITHNHTILQLIVGSIVGSIIGYITYLFANNKIKGNLKEKQDDNGPL
jgi:dolichyldiphosphatase